MSDITVRNVPEKERYVAEVDGVEAGFTVYHLRHGKRYFFVHTEIHDAFVGQRVGAVLVRGALDDVRERGGVIVPICPFVAAFIEKNPEYDDLVDHQIFDRIADRLHQDEST